MQVIIILCKMTKLTVKIVAFKDRLSKAQDLSVRSNVGLNSVLIA